MKRMGKGKSRRVAVVLASLLGGPALVVFSLRDLHVRLEITREAEGGGRGQGPVS